ncbi:MFS general substrate transporter [Panus rudis PR-1116 ss-1]|nr:MFS general substrate transporter [Panus rudis PR-1116 ss-1]
MSTNRHRTQYLSYGSDDEYALSTLGIMTPSRPETAHWRQTPVQSPPEGDAYSMSSTDAKFVFNQRRVEALAEVDNAKFSRFHLRVCFVAGVGFFADAYDIFAINIASQMIGYLYHPGGTETNRGLHRNQDLAVKIASHVGILVGQLSFGFLADLVGRKRMYGIELCVIIFATLAQALAGSARAVGIVGVLIVWRFLMGVGIGGDYPLSAILTSEFAPIHLRGRLMTSVFANQGLGQLVGAIVAWAVTAAAPTGKGNEEDLLNYMDKAWRILLGIGCVPGVLALGLRLTIPDTPRFTMDIARNVGQAKDDIENFLRSGTFRTDPDATIERVQAPTASWKDFKEYLSRRSVRPRRTLNFMNWNIPSPSDKLFSRNWVVLLAVAYSWFVVDFAFYGLTLNSSSILQAIQFSNSPRDATSSADAFHSLEQISKGNFILTIAGQIPGYIVSIMLIDFVGRKRIQYIGFAALCVIFLIMGPGYGAFAKPLPPNGSIPGPVVAYVFLYCLANFFQNFGPNTTTFVIPGEIFPTRYRSTIHGISAASGKFGAIVVQVVFEFILFNANGSARNSATDAFAGQSIKRAITILFSIFAVLMLSGFVATWFIPETNKRSLEALSGEGQTDFITAPPQPKERKL